MHFQEVEGNESTIHRDRINISIGHTRRCVFDLAVVTVTHNHMLVYIF